MANTDEAQRPIVTTAGAPAGWACYSCGSWVPNGITHHCPTGRANDFNYGAPFGGPASPRLSDADIERIARRVVELLREEGLARLDGFA